MLAFNSRLRVGPLDLHLAWVIVVAYALWTLHDWYRSQRSAFHAHSSSLLEPSTTSPPPVATHASGTVECAYASSQNREKGHA